MSSIDYARRTRTLYIRYIFKYNYIIISSLFPLMKVSSVFIINTHAWKYLFVKTEWTSGINLYLLFHISLQIFYLLPSCIYGNIFSGSNNESPSCSNSSSNTCKYFNCLTYFRQFTWYNENIYEQLARSAWIIRRFPSRW